MPSKRWFPSQFELPNGVALGRRLDSGIGWQIYYVDSRNKVLVADSELATRWFASELVPESAGIAFGFEDRNYFVLQSGEDFRLEPVSAYKSPDTKAEAMAFALSLYETRSIVADAPLQDAIYLERLSRLLPTWSISETINDAELLGKWLSGGVNVSVLSSRRISALLSWMGRDSVEQLVKAAGLLDQHGPNAELRKVIKQGDSSTESSNLKRDVSPRGDEDAYFSLPGRPALEAFFNEHVVDIVLHPEPYRALGITFPTAIVLHGPPGCGKTFAVDRLVEFLDWPIFHIDSNSVGSPYIHETSRKVSEIFEQAIKSAPAAVVIDEMESYLSDRQMHQGSGFHHVEEIAEFLRRIPEANENQVLVVGMTNRLEMIDPAILRRGRFDHVIEVGMPSKEEVSGLVSSLLDRLPHSDDLDPSVLINALAGRPLSDASFAIREAARLAAQANRRQVEQKHLSRAVDALPPADSASEGHPIGFIWDS